MRERSHLIGCLVDLRDVINRLIFTLNDSALVDTKKGTSFSPLFEREYQEYRQWPPAGQNNSELTWNIRSALAAQSLNFELKGRVLEYTTGPVPIISEHCGCDAEIVLDSTYKFESNYSVIHKSFATVEGQFDYVLIFESLSFCQQPEVVLSQLRSRLKPDGKCILRVRPWTSPAGGFQESYHNWAYAHLLSDLPHNDLIKWRVVQPLKDYDELLSRCGFLAITRTIRSDVLIPQLRENCDAFEILKERTWGAINNDEARAILAIRHIDYVLTI